MASKGLVEQIHYGYAQNRKKWKAWDIIASGKEISVLFGTPESMMQTTYFGDEAKAIVKFLASLQTKEEE